MTTPSSSGFTDGAYAHLPTTPAEEAHPPFHRWRIETYDPLAEEWGPSSPHKTRESAAQYLAVVNENYATWRDDGTPVKRRLVRETTTYTVEDPS